jgi:hypothetical protein
MATVAEIEEQKFAGDLAKEEREELVVTLLRLCVATEMRSDFELDQEGIVRALAEDGWQDYLNRLNHLVHLWLAGLVEFDNVKRHIRLTKAGQEKGAFFAKSAREYVAAHPEALVGTVSKETL